MNVTPPYKHTATGALQGYIYQFRFALIEFIKKNSNYTSNVDIAIEILDDISYHSDGVTTEVAQTKHSIDTNASLTDSSTDVWKTIAIWIKLLENKDVTECTDLKLITTAKAARESGVYSLRADSKNIKLADAKLMIIAKSSTSSTNAEYYKAYTQLSEEKRIELLNQVTIIDEQIQNQDLSDELKTSLYHICDIKHIELLIYSLEGWWIELISKTLAEKDISKRIIKSNILQNKLDYLRESYKKDNLPLNLDLMDANPEVGCYFNHVFIQQLDLIQINNQRKIIAASNFYKASTQRNEWATNFLLIDGELEKYDTRLFREWQNKYAQITDDIEDSDDLTPLRAGKKLYKWAEMHAGITIRDEKHDPIITRGTYHILANQKKVGWHPDYDNLL